MNQVSNKEISTNEVSNYLKGRIIDQEKNDDSYA